MSKKKEEVIDTLIDKYSPVQILGVLASRLATLQGAGYQYGGDRDLYEALGYPASLSFNDYWGRYKRQDIAKAIINRPVNATWRGRVQLLESSDDNETPLEKEWDLLYDTFGLKSLFTRLDKLASIGRYGVILFGFDDVRGPLDFAKEASGKKKLLYLKALAENNAEILEFENDTNNPRYGKPKMYQITTAEEETRTTSVKVHYTRILHVVPNMLDSEIYGVPELEDVYNRLMDLEKLTGGSAEMFWRGARPGYHGKINPEYQLTKEVEDGLKDQFDEYEHNLRRFLVGQGVEEIKSLESQVSNPENHIVSQLKMISAVKGIPLRILTGSERGELASSEDKDSWLEKIYERREEFAEPLILLPFVKKCQEHGILPISKEDYSVKWMELWSLSEKDKAEIGNTRAKALKEYSMSNQDIVPPSAFFKFFLGFEDDQIELIEEMMDAEIQNEDYGDNEEEI